MVVRISVALRSVTLFRREDKGKVYKSFHKIRGVQVMKSQEAVSDRIKLEA